MIKILVRLRSPDDHEFHDSWEIMVPEVPRIGDYVSVSSNMQSDALGTDMIVHKVWWRMKAPSDTVEVGRLLETIVECLPSVGPQSSERWREAVEGARSRGVKIEAMDTLTHDLSHTDEYNDR